MENQKNFVAPLPEDPKITWARETRARARAEAIESAQAPSAAYDGDDIPDEIKNDWQSLVATAKIKFPDHLALKFSLPPKKRVICIAHSIGWPVTKIATASGFGESTIYRYLAEDNAVEFIKAFEYHTGTRDAKAVVDNEQYTSLQVLKDLRDNPDVSDATRKEIAMWFYEQKHGKAKEIREVAKTDLRALTEQLAKTATPEWTLDDADTRAVQKPSAN